MDHHWFNIPIVKICDTKSKCVGDQECGVDGWVFCNCYVADNPVYPVFVIALGS